jgi:hypothetical protein
LRAECREEVSIIQQAKPLGRRRSSRDDSNTSGRTNSKRRDIRCSVLLQSEQDIVLHLSSVPKVSTRRTGGQNHCNRQHDKGHGDIVSLIALCCGIDQALRCAIEADDPDQGRIGSGKYSPTSIGTTEPLMVGLQHWCLRGAYRKSMPYQQLVEEHRTRRMTSTRQDLEYSLPEQ